MNARIRKVYIGIEDPDPTVCRKGIQFLIDNGVEVEMYPQDLQEEISDCNKVFLSAATERARLVEDKKRTWAWNGVIKTAVGCSLSSGC